MKYEASFSANSAARILFFGFHIMSKDAPQLVMDTKKKEWKGKTNDEKRLSPDRVQTYYIQMGRPVLWPLRHNHCRQLMMKFKQINRLHYER